MTRVVLTGAAEVIDGTQPKDQYPRSKRPFLQLRCRRLARTLFGSAVVCALLQLVLGASPLVVLLCLLASGAGLLAFASLGAYNFGAWLALFYVLGNALIALYAKTALGQPLDSNLIDADAAYAMVLLGSLAMLGAALVAKFLRVGRPILGRNPQSFAVVGWGSFILGLALAIANRVAQDGAADPGAVFGGFAVFRDLLFMAVIARTAMVLERTANQKSIDAVGLLFLIGGVFAGFIDNQKTQAAMPVVAYFATTTFYRGGINVKVLVALLVGGAIFSVLLAPIVHGLRALGQQDMPLTERVAFVADVSSRLLESPEQLAMLEQLGSGQFLSSSIYYNYFGDGAAGQMLLGRYASVQQVDPIIAQADRMGTRGGDAIWPSLPRLLPSFLNRQKSEFGVEFETVVHYGLIHPLAGKYPTLPLVGQVYAAYGVLGVVLTPFVVFLLLLLVVKKLSWNLNRNIFGIFFFVQFVIVYASQGSFIQYVGAALRTFPIFTAVFLLLALLSRFNFSPALRVSHAQPRAIPLDPV